MSSRVPHCVEVRSDIKLAELSHVLEAAMGWLGGHLHAFEAGGVHYEIPDGESFGFRPPRDERKARLGEVLPVAKSKMRWDYDFGHGWENDIVVETIEPTPHGLVTQRRTSPTRGGRVGERGVALCRMSERHPMGTVHHH